MKPAIERLRAEVRSDREAVSRWFDDLAALSLGTESSRGTPAQAAWALHHAYSLHDLRAFRHFVRHAYAVELDPERLADLQRRSAALRPGLEEDLDRLDDWLRELAEAVE